MTEWLQQVQAMFDAFATSTAFWIMGGLCVLFGAAALIGDLVAWVRRSLPSGGGEVGHMGTRVTRDREHR